MRWFKPNLRGSIYAIFSASSPPSTTVAAQVDIEDIRHSMLQIALAAAAPDDRLAVVARRIRYAVDVQALWFLRGDLVALLAGSLGEAAALERVGAVSDLFEALLPNAMRSRPSPLKSAPKDAA
jgi:hypothetical protein